MRMKQTIYCERTNDFAFYTSGRWDNTHRSNKYSGTVNAQWVGNRLGNGIFGDSRWCTCKYRQIESRSGNKRQQITMVIKEPLDGLPNLDSLFTPHHQVAGAQIRHKYSVKEKSIPYQHQWSLHIRSPTPVAEPQFSNWKQIGRNCCKTHPSRHRQACSHQI